MKISKLRISATFSMVMVIVLIAIEKYTKERVWFYIQIGVTLLAMILMTVDGKRNKSTVSPRITKALAVLGIIMQLILIGILIYLLLFSKL